MELTGVARLFGCLRLTVQVFSALDGEVAGCLLRLRAIVRTHIAAFTR